MRITQLDVYQDRANHFASYSGNAAGLLPQDVLDTLDLPDMPEGLASLLKGRLSEHVKEIATFLYPSSKLAGEAGEVAEKLAKQIRDKGVLTWDGISEEDRQALKKELGDVLWYVAEIANKLHFRLSEIATANIEKLTGRVERGTLLGDGDDR